MERMSTCGGFGPGAAVPGLTFPLRVQLGFVGLAVVIGGLLGGTRYLWLAAAAVMVSVFVHEVGHVRALRRAQVDSRVVLHGGGGVTIPLDEMPRGIAGVRVYLAGPLTALVALWLPAVVVLRVWSAPPDTVVAGLTFLVWINAYLSLYSLLPVVPLDGGRVMIEVLDALVGKRRCMLIAHLVSIVAAAVAWWVVLRCIGHYTIGEVLAISAAAMGGANAVGVFTFESRTAIEKLDEAYRRMGEDDLGAAEECCAHVIHLRATKGLRTCAAQYLVWIALTRGDTVTARAMVTQRPALLRRNDPLRCALGDEPTHARAELTARALLDQRVPAPSPAFLRDLAASGVMGEIGDRLLAAKGPAAITMRHRFMTLLYHARMFEEAASFGTRILATDYLPARVAFNIGCCHARLGDVDGAIDWLERSFLGYRYRAIDKLTTDTDLEALRGQPRFERLRERLGAPSGLLSG